MNRFKSIFITLFVVLVNLALLHVATLSWHSPLGSGWFGVFVLALPNFYFFVWLFMGRKGRTTRNMHLLMATNLTGYAMVLTDPGMESNPWPLLVGTLLFFGSLAMVFWYSNLGSRKPVGLAEGEKLPPFVLKTLAGEEFSSEQLKGKPGLLVFYEGAWNPLGVTQVRELAGRFIDLDRLGMQVYAISPQPVNKSAELAARLQVPFEFLVDPQAEVARRLGLRAEHGVPWGVHRMGYGEHSVLPTVLMINKHGRIVHAHFTDNLRVRPEPDALLELARQRLGALDA
ncbi:peroxiredoxin family protein [Limnobacter sp.]|uniref:peroxiredoxin family protein n=1 Tax=Limnobacter sp. TaxID=2003368 RepID=UPI003513DC29